MGLFHHPVSEGTFGRMEFSHFSDTYERGAWRRDNVFSLDHFKINVFARGEFTLLVGAEAFEPARGSICMLRPLEIHSGSILRRTELEYYQVDLWPETLERICGGAELLKRMDRCRQGVPAYLRPEKERGENCLALCARVEEALNAGETALAFGRVLELLGGLCESYEDRPAQQLPGFLSATAERALRCISDYREGKLTVTELAARCGVSESYLSRVFRTEIGETACFCILRQRLLASLPSLLAGENTAGVACSFGFSDASHYIAAFRRCFGCTPGEYRRRQNQR